VESRAGALGSRNWGAWVPRRFRFHGWQWQWHISLAFGDFYSLIPLLFLQEGDE